MSPEAAGLKLRSKGWRSERSKRIYFLPTRGLVAPGIKASGEEEATKKEPC